MARRIVTDLQAERELVRRARYGMIETAGGRFSRLVLRTFPPGASWFGVQLKRRLRAWGPCEDRCRLYYKQPVGHDAYLALVYIESRRGASFATGRRAMTVLDEIAEIKGSDALLCHVGNDQISDRLLFRWGWTIHELPSFGRHFIKRRYEAPTPPPEFAEVYERILAGR